MLVNRLTKRIEVYRFEMMEGNLGSLEKHPVLLKSIWGQIVPKTGSVHERANTQFAEMTHKIVIRANAIRDLTDKDLIKYNRRTYEIMYILNPYERNELLEIFCKEKVL